MPPLNEHHPPPDYSSGAAAAAAAAAPTGSGMITTKITVSSTAATSPRRTTGLASAGPSSPTTSKDNKSESTATIAGNDAAGTSSHHYASRPMAHYSRPPTPERPLHGHRPPRTTMVTPTNHKTNNGASSWSSKQKPPPSPLRQWPVGGSSLSSDHDSPRSGGGGGGDGHVAAAPAMVVSAAGDAPPLVRDLSDLSGSYWHGQQQHQRERSASPYWYASASENNSHTSYQRPWRQAGVLSKSHHHPQPPPDDHDSIGVLVRLRNTKTAHAIVVENDEEGVEIVADNMPQQPSWGNNPSATALGHARPAAAVSGSSPEQQNSPPRPQHALAESSALTTLLSPDVQHQSMPGLCMPHHHHRRIPLILILMDPARKTFELQQMWIDPVNDSVRDILHTLQHSLRAHHEHWRQDYDGVFCVRNHHFDPLIHVLPVSKYQTQPYEVWVAKPWAMAAAATVSYASTLLNHLQQIGVLDLSTVNAIVKQKGHGSPNSRGSSSHSAGSYSPSRNNSLNDDVLLVLSTEAQKRIHVPHEQQMMQHHHAVQFLSFCPAFEMPLRVDVLAAAAAAAAAGDDGSASQLSESNCGSLAAYDSPHHDYDDDVVDEDQRRVQVEEILLRQGSPAADLLARARYGASSPFMIDHQADAGPQSLLPPPRRARGDERPQWSPLPPPPEQVDAEREHNPSDAGDDPRVSDYDRDGDGNGDEMDDRAIVVDGKQYPLQQARSQSPRTLPPVVKMGSSSLRRHANKLVCRSQSNDDNDDEIVEPAAHAATLRDPPPPPAHTNMVGRAWSALRCGKRGSSGGKNSSAVATCRLQRELSETDTSEEYWNYHHHHVMDDNMSQRCTSTRQLWKVWGEQPRHDASDTEDSWTGGGHYANDKRPLLHSSSDGGLGPAVAHDWGRIVSYTSSQSGGAGL